MAITDIIPPEVKNDPFYDTLITLSENGNIRTFLEIGSSSGEGSTEAIVKGIRRRNDQQLVRMFCMELSRPRFIRLTNNYFNDTFVKTYNLSSISLKEFPTKEEVTYFYNHTQTNLNNFTLDMVLGWLDQDIQYIKDVCLDYNGIEFIKKSNHLEYFDMVLIDGSEFTGERELYATIGAKFIALDDINTYKSFNCYKLLSAHVNYKLVAQDLTVRNGFAIFQRNA